MKMPGGNWYTHKQLIYYWIIAGHSAAVKQYMERRNPTNEDDLRYLDMTYQALERGAEPQSYPTAYLENMPPLPQTGTEN